MGFDRQAGMNGCMRAERRLSREPVDPAILWKIRSDGQSGGRPIDFPRSKARASGSVFSRRSPVPQSSRHPLKKKRALGEFQAVVSGWSLESRHIEADQRAVARDQTRVIADSETGYASGRRKTCLRQISQ